VIAAMGGSCLGCGGSRLQGTEYRNDELAFRLGPLPPGAELVDSDESLVTLTNRQSGASSAVSARCRLDGDDVPLTALAQHLFLQMTDKKIFLERPLQLDGRDALEVHLSARLDGVSRYLIVFVLKKDGCVYDFVHVDRGGNSSALEADREAFRSMVLGFHTLPR
jgi:hypothetical protein